jgi:YYY domain-containing protein
MLQFLLWYISITILGLLVFPLAYGLFPALSDRGYSLSRALGLLLWGFVFWLSVSFGLVRNEIGGLLVTLALLVGISVWALYALKKQSANPEVPEGLRFDLQPIWGWIKTNLRLVLSVEILFLLAFAAWAFVRANNAEITSSGGEKWMEVAFINAILHSPTFPPHDPWLSGYAISYYYFGYVLTAMLAMFTSTTASIAHNLMLSLVFALSAVGVYGLLYNLLAAYWRKSGLAASLGAFFGPLFLLLVSNAEGFLELLHAYGIGWSGKVNFWTWLNMKDLSDAPALPYGWAPRFWFWWRASRVIHDYDLRGNFLEIIDEFPFFSYLLGDLHPHVLAMPFGLLALALGLNIYLGGWKGVTNLFGFKIPLRREGLALSAVVLGGLAFLNTWDFPVYLAVVCAAFMLSRVNELGWSWQRLEDFLRVSIPLGLASILLYLPFYVSFSSQAGGILPNVLFPTRGVYLWIMFGTLLVPLFLFLVWLPGKRAANWRTGFLLAAGFTVLLWVFSSALGIFAGQTEAGRSFITSQGLVSTSDVLYEAMLRRLQFGFGLLTILLLIGIPLAYLSAPRTQPDEQAQTGINPLPLVFMFVLFGALLVLAPEFVYLRDQFGWRMNTVFKFYYQAWAFWSLAAAFGFVVVLRELRGFKLVLFSFSMIAVLVVGLTYPILALPNKTENFNSANPERRSLDGAAVFAANNPDDYAAIQILATAPQGPVVEAVGGSYSEYARISTYSGQPAVLGWPGHESQWRGGYAEMGSRSDDIARLYNTFDWADANSVINNYGIRYIYIGPLERKTYQVNEAKFSANLPVFYARGQVVIYEVP